MENAPHHFRQGLIEPEELAERMHPGQPPVHILDASFALPGTAHNPRLDYERRHIPGALFFDIEAVSDRETDLPHMLPSPAEFEYAVETLGISSGEQVVIYDQTGLAMAAARAWWMFRAFGHEEVCVLNGGLQSWAARGYPVSDTPVGPAHRGAFSAELRPDLLHSRDDVLRALHHRSATIIDARAAARFSGQAPEPRPGLRSGHIPGSCNIPYTALIDPETGRMKPPEALREIFADIPPGAVISTCGSGVTACVLALGLYLVGRQDVAVYDGSWAEWGRPDAGTPVALLA